MYILDKNNNNIFNNIINTGGNILLTNIEVTSGYKITLKMIDNNEIDISEIIIDVENYVEKKDINIYFLYTLYGICGIIMMIIIFLAIRRIF
jgi:hypothetical protein